MTTIAYKDGFLVSDTQVSDEGYLARTYMQKIIKTDEALVGASGGAWAGQLFLAWCKGEAEEEDFHTKLDVEDDFTGILIDKDGLIHLYNRYLVPEIIPDKFFAIGSGSKIALPMMDAGHTAYEAVQWACKYDLYSGGSIDQVSL